MVCNQIQGTLPSNLGAVFPRLESFGISRNKFSGTIPVSLGNASNLVRLQMAENKLHGQSMVWDMKYGKKEMRIGKRPTDKIFQGTSNLRNLVKGSLPEEVMEISDPVLVREKEGEMNGNNHLNKASIQLWIKIEESLVAILEIGVA
ncbi:unnamed protein product [Prunus armeniaca]